MAKVELKQPIVDEIKASLEGAQGVVVVDYRGLTVEQDTQLRKQMREEGIVYKVYKNTMLNFAIKGTEFEPLSQHLDEIAQQGDQLVAVVFGVGHQVPAAHVEPPDPVEILPEMLFDGFQRQLQVVRARLAQHVEVQPVDPGGQIVQLIGRNAEARAGDTRVIKVGLHGRILRVDAQAARNAAQQRHRPETPELRDRVEGDMVAATEYLVDIAVGIDGSVGVRRLAVLLEYKPRFGGGTRRGTVGMACQLGENAPHGAGLQGYDNFGARLAAHAVDHGQIAIQQRLVEDVARRRQLQEVNHRNVFNWIRSLVPSARKRCCPARRRRSKRCKNSKLPAKP